MPHEMLTPCLPQGNGVRMPGWYDFVSRTTTPSPIFLGNKPSAPRLTYVEPSPFPQATFDGTVAALRTNEDERGMLVSRTYLHDLIDQEISCGIPPESIALSGFSQGGAMALFAGLTYPKRLAALATLSAYLPLSSKFRDLAAECARSAGSDRIRGPNQDTPIFMGHGDEDMVFLPELGDMSFRMLKEWGWRPELNVYR